MMQKLHIQMRYQSNYNKFHIWMQKLYLLPMWVEEFAAEVLGSTLSTVGFLTHVIHFCKLSVIGQSKLLPDKNNLGWIIPRLLIA